MNTLGSPTGDRFWRYALAVLLAGATLAIFLPTVRQGFLYYDDDVYVFNNNEVLTGLGWPQVGYRWSQTSPALPIPLVHWPSIEWALTSQVQGNWHPLTMISHQIDVSIYPHRAGKPWPGGMHLTSTLLHTASVLILYFTLCRWTGYPGRSAIVAALFAFHPTRVESVAWIAERKDVLAGLFWVLTMAAYGAYARCPGLWRYLLVTLLLACGLMCKPMLVTLPFVLLLLDYWPLRRFSFARREPRFDPLQGLALVIEKLPWFALIGVSAVITFHVQRAQGFVISIEQQTLGERLITAINAYGSYLRNTFWPTRLCIIYPLPGETIADAWTATSAVVLVALTILALWLVRRRPYVTVGWFWFLGTLVPVIGLVQIGSASMADRYTYLPLVGIFLSGTWWVADLLPRTGWSPRRLRLAGAAMALVVLLPSAALCVRQVGFWKDAVTVFSRALDVTDDNYVAHYNLGNAYAGTQRFQEAIPHYLRTLELWPTYPACLFNLGSAHMRLAHYEQALDAYRRCNAMAADDPNTLYNMAQCEERLGNIERAARLYEASLKLQFRETTALNLAATLNRLGRPDQAMSTYQALSKIAPRNRQVYLSVAWIYATHYQEEYRNPVEALKLARQVVDTLTDRSTLWVAAQDTLGAAYAANGQFDQAIEHAQKAYKRVLAEVRARQESGMLDAAAESDQYAKAIARRIKYYERREPYFVNPALYPI